MGCGGFFGGSGGGGGGNLSGTLTETHVPFASGVHTLADSPLIWDEGVFQWPAANFDLGEDDFDYGPLSVSQTGTLLFGADITLDANLGQADFEFLHVHSSASIDGLLSLGASGMVVNTDKFILDGSTGGFSTKGECLFEKQITLDGSTVLGEVVVPIVSSVATIDSYQSDFYSVVVDQNVTFAAPTNPGNGRRFMLRLDIDGLGAWAINWDLNFEFQNATPPTIPTNVAGSYYLGFVRNPNTNKWDNPGIPIGPY